MHIAGVVVREVRHGDGEGRGKRVEVLNLIRKNDPTSDRIRAFKRP